LPDIRDALAIVKRQNVDPGIVSKSPGDQQKLAPFRVGRDVRRSFSYNDRQLPSPELSEVHKAG
jgi:hypothetical protein